MANLVKILGTKEFLKRLDVHTKKAARGFQVGITKAGLFVQRESMLIVPVDTGNLKAGAFTRRNGTGFGAKVLVGYVADYAIYVHENLDAAHGEEYNRKYAAQIAGSGGGGTKRDKKSGQLLAGQSNPYHLRGPNQKAKFLTIPLNEHRQRLVMMVKAEIERSLGL